jgi:hypothetical protein
MKHCTTSRKVAGSILNEAIGFSNSPNSSSHTKTLRSTLPQTEMSTRNLPGGKRLPAHKADNLTAICEAIVQKMWEPRRLTDLWASTDCHRDGFTFILCQVDRTEDPFLFVINSESMNP